MKIVLIGYRGSGKSTVGKILAQKLNFSFYSLDAQIEKQCQKSIVDFVAKQGWEAFRTIETQILKKALPFSNMILDCGGGVVEKEENRLLLKKEKKVFFLKAPLPVLYDRLKDKTNRPALTQNQNFLQEIEEVYLRRLPFYQECASFIINANQEPYIVAQEIFNLLQSSFFSNSKP